MKNVKKCSGRFLVLLSQFVVLCVPKGQAADLDTGIKPDEVVNHQLLQIFDGPATPNYEEFDAYLPFRSDKHDQFSWMLLKKILLEEQQNVIISPFSVKLVLALLLEAAGNNTRTQLELYSTLTDVKSQLNLRSFYKKILTLLKRENPFYTFNLETKMYTDEFVEPQQKYAAMLHTFYNTDIQRLKFAQPQISAAIINDWCSNVTNGHIPLLVDKVNIENSVLLLANVIYFNGLWRRQFNDTFNGVFFKTPNEQLRVEFMEQVELFYYYNSADLDVKILRLPYKGRRFAMFILLPNTKAGLDEIIRDLENNQFKRMQWMMDEVKVKVTIPKFKFDFSKNIKKTLVELGINEIFTSDASLPGLARGAQVAGKLKVSSIYQKAGIDVNEKGTEAFASTVVEFENKFGGSNVVEEFNVNRPFIFIIEEETTGNIIFAGKVLNPLV